MGKRTRIIYASLLAVLIGGIAAYVFIPREPRYGGVGLTEWVMQSGTNRQEASVALAAMGSKSVPFLIKSLSRRDSASKQRFVRFVQRLPLGLAKLFPVSSARPEVVRALSATALVHIGASATNAISALVQALGDEHDGVRANVAAALVQISSSPAQAGKVVEALLKVAEDKHSYARGNACLALAEWRIESDQVVPVLLRRVHDNDSYVQDQAWYALSKFTNLPESAIREITQALENEDIRIRQHATNALNRIQGGTQ